MADMLLRKTKCRNVSLARKLESFSGRILIDVIILVTYGSGLLCVYQD